MHQSPEKGRQRCWLLQSSAFACIGTSFSPLLYVGCHWKERQTAEPKPYTPVQQGRKFSHTKPVPAKKSSLIVIGLSLDVKLR